MPNVLISKSAWNIIECEIGHFAADGNKEAIVYPLFGFLRASQCIKSPWEPINLTDIDTFVVTHAFAPPREYCNHSQVRAGLQFPSPEVEERYENALQAWARQYTSQYPTLEIGNIHSHPFATGCTTPSGIGGDYTRIYSLWQHMMTRGVNTALEIIVCRSKKTSQVHWIACCFGFDNGQKVVSLGAATIVSDSDSRVRKVLSRPFRELAQGPLWENAQRQNVPQLHTFRRASNGWIAIGAEVEGNRQLAVYLPPSFPNAPHVLYQTYDSAERRWSSMKLWRLQGKGFDYTLVRSIRDHVLTHARR